MYKGEVDLEMFGRCLKLSRHPVIYNGDIVGQDDFTRLAGRFSRVSGWMIGRGALADPFLPARIKNLPLPKDPKAQLRLFHDEIFSAYQEILFGPGHILGRMKGLWFYLSNSFNESGKLLKKIQKCKTMRQYNLIIEQLFE
jgi:tRNA-dihydrouridine synthase